MTAILHRITEAIRLKGNMELPKFSIITPSYNQGDTIAETIESVLKQDYPNFEHIVLDGGSSDQTVAVLKKYPHLKWQSAPDRGQADALNRGLQMATGDVVTWLNSDDWYAAGVFFDVAKAIKEHPIVLGACELIDSQGKTIYVVENVERNWFDMLKYWIPYSIPAQPSIFMRKDLLQSVKRLDDSLIDESFYYTMDYDLWMRIAEKCPFALTIPRVLSYYRMTENNKTSHDIDGMPYAEPEMSRVFLAAESKRLPSSTGMTICVLGGGSGLRDTLSDLEKQVSNDFEVIAPVTEKEEFRVVRKELNAWNQKMREQQRFVVSTAHLVENQGNFLKKLVSLASGKIVLIVGAGTRFSQAAVLETLNLFKNDSIGVAFPSAEVKEGQALQNQQSHLLARVSDLISDCSAPLAFAFRRIALLEVGGIDGAEAITGALKAALAQICFAGWKAELDRDLGLKEFSTFGQIDSLVDRERLLGKVNALNQASKFSSLRANFGFGVKLTNA